MNTSRAAPRRRPRRWWDGSCPVPLLAALLVAVCGCRSLRVDLTTTGPTPAAADASRSAPLTEAPVAEAAAASPTVLPQTPDPPRPTTAAPNATSTPSVAVPTPTALATPLPDPPAETFAPRGVTQSVSGAINARGQRDRYRFDGVQGQLLEARVKRTSGISLQPDLELIDPAGLSEDKTYQIGEESILTRRLASSGAYTLVVSGSGQGPYVATWSLDRFGQLVSDGAVSAEITERNQRDRYHFEARQGQLLDARVKRTSGIGLEPVIDLFDPMLLKETSTNFGYGPEGHLERQLSSSGTYQLVVSSAGLGPYTVSLTLR